MKKTLTTILPLILIFVGCSKPIIPSLSQDEYSFEVNTVVYNNIVFVNFDGENVNSQIRNNGEPFYAPPSGIQINERPSIISRIRDKFQGFRVTITTNRTLYEASSPQTRLMVIVTNDFTHVTNIPGAAGVSAFNSWGWGDPSFVSSKMLEWNSRWVADAIVHEIGHILGLRHQSVYDNCTKRYEYRPGTLMGSTREIDGGWAKGPNNIACDDIQDDVAIISSKFN